MLQFYGLREQPFGTTPDPRFFFDLPAHREAAASLITGMEYRVGFAALLAEPGLGKTTILYDIIHQYEKKAETAFIFNTLGSASSLLQRIAEDLGVPASEDLAQTHENLKLFVAERGGKRPVLVIIDEAQNLDDEALEAVRLLSDFETANCKLLHIILAGQPQLATKLSQESMVQLLQRITMIARLQRLTPKEISGYIRHRSRIAGAERDLFSPAAMTRIATASGGVPREINRICFNALLLGFAAKKATVPVSVIEEVLADLRCTPDEPKVVETQSTAPSAPQRFHTSSTFEAAPQRIAPSTIESTRTEWSVSSTGNRPETPVTPSVRAVTQTQPLAAIPGIQPVISRPAPEPEIHDHVDEPSLDLPDSDISLLLDPIPSAFARPEAKAAHEDHIHELDDDSFADRMNARLRAMADVASENPRRRGPITPLPSALPSAGLAALAHPVPEPARVSEPTALALEPTPVVDEFEQIDASDRWRLAMVPAEKTDIVLEDEAAEPKFRLPEYWERYALGGAGVLFIAFLSLPPVHHAIGKGWHDLLTPQPVIADVRPAQVKEPVVSPARVTVSVTPPPKRYRIARVEEPTPVPVTDTVPVPQPSTNGTGLTILGTPSVTKVEGDSGAPIVSMSQATQPLLPTPAPRKPARVYFAEPTPPKLLSGKDPDYPATAKSLHMEGSVSMKLQIGVDGKVTGISVQDGTSLFVTAATDAVKQWTYQPAMLNGRPIPSELAVKVDFSLNPQK